MNWIRVAWNQKGIKARQVNEWCDITVPRQSPNEQRGHHYRQWSGHLVGGLHSWPHHQHAHSAQRSRAFRVDLCRCWDKKEFATYESWNLHKLHTVFEIIFLRRESVHYSHDINKNHITAYSTVLTCSQDQLCHCMRDRFEHGSRVQRRAGVWEEVRTLPTHSHGQSRRAETGCRSQYDQKNPRHPPPPTKWGGLHGACHWRTIIIH